MPLRSLGNLDGVRPIPETQAVFDHLSAAGDTELPAAVLEVGDRVTEIVPECVGLSLSVVAEGLTMTLVATDTRAAQLDAAQYLDDGPCLAAVERAETLEASVDDLLDEGRWLMYARLSAAFGVASSLSLPVTVDGEVVGGANIYASTSRAFEGRHEAVAAALGTPAEWAVTNADLSFSTRLLAIEAPEQFAARQDVDIAIGVISSQHGVSSTQAHDMLRRAAARAGISETEAARALSGLYSSDD
jgi:GAF domain-containing protein